MLLGEKIFANKFFEMEISSYTQFYKFNHTTKNHSTIHASSKNQNFPQLALRTCLCMSPEKLSYYNDLLMLNTKIRLKPLISDMNILCEPLSIPMSFTFANVLHRYMHVSWFSETSIQKRKTYIQFLS